MKRTAGEDNTILVGIAGGSCAGKSTLVRKIEESLLPVKAVSITSDRYYKPLDHQEPGVRCRCNFDSPAMIDIPLLRKHLRSLKNGGTAELPVYDYHIHTRTERTETAGPAPVILAEGLLLLAIPSLLPLFDLKVYIEACDELRLSRRLSRDREERGRSEEAILRQYFETVLPAHQKLVRPSRFRADLVVGGEGVVEEEAARVARLIRNLLSKAFSG